MKRFGKKLWLALALAAALAGTALLYFVPPGSVAFYPRCLFHQMTGLNCPGCGGLRAAHQLLHGHLREAFALNPLLFVVMPVFAWVGFSWLWLQWKGRELPHPFQRPVWIWTLAAAVIGFGIVRNLPIHPFAALAP
ncbi:MAG: DUF2752 domain-containing protein [Verrucomicrobia bacterium]|nr:DUF2752 domain-containing protein [Verrucomicrobiota bacterium]